MAKVSNCSSLCLGVTGAAYKPHSATLIARPPHHPCCAHLLHTHPHAGKVVSPYQRAIMFVDNAGADVVLGMIPFARELLRMGAEVRGTGGRGWRLRV